MLIPDCRRDEIYNEDFLNKDDTGFVKGFDWCAEHAADAAFNNLSCIFDEDSGGKLAEVLAAEAPEHLRTKYDWERLDGTAEAREVRTYGDYLRYVLADWIERQRDELITSMIDGMDEGEYAELKAAAIERNETLPDPKEYYNTRKVFNGTAES